MSLKEETESLFSETEDSLEQLLEYRESIISYLDTYNSLMSDYTENLFMLERKWEELYEVSPEQAEEIDIEQFKFAQDESDIINILHS